ncbi:FHA domain-containing protein [Myxacorys almedinensis]|uniref:FHA domain-containing protein n=1 Tax=Myxacorys almedinensis A TaxID=2690445 RepID=A0A8J7Z0D3_9CYAN|nr:FHA domain-containing protein [Myxacorys almedinensis]NDJ15803.1 FHA domain-containing protein [Myxacorys almedinensis A]
MTSELNGLDSANALLGLSPVTDCPTSDLAPQAEAFWSEPDDGVEDNFAKRPTLSIDHEKESSSHSAFSIFNSLKYIQGVLQRDQVYIVTNLVDSQTQILRQPQTAWTIGRNRAAALPLQDRNLSRRHAVLLYVAGDGFYLVDLNSMNGSYINDQRVQQRQLLHDGDRIRIGSMEFSFFLSADDRTLDPIHPEVLARLTNRELRPAFIDFSELKEEISFNISTR